MPTVPTVAAPQVQPPLDNPAGQYLSDRGATASSFGAGVGSALQGVGRAVEGFGDVLQRNVNKIQDDNNRAWANDAFVDTTIKAGELKSKLQTLEGKAAADFYKNEYIPQLRALQQQTSQSAPNQEAKRYFEQDFKRRMGYDIENGAGYAATQTKHYQNAAADAKIGIANSSAAETRNPREFKSSLETIKSATLQKARQNSWGPEQTEYETDKATGTAWATHIESVGMTDPFQAERIYKANKGQIPGFVQPKIEKWLETQISNQGAKIVGDAITEGRIPPGGKETVAAITPDSDGNWLGKAVKAAQEYANALYPDNPAFENNVVNQVRQRYRVSKDIHNEAEKQSYNTVSLAVLGMGRQQGPIKDMSEIFTNATLNESFNNLNPARQKAIENWVRSNAVKDIPFTPERQAIMTRYQGMAKTNPEKFAQINPGDLDLPQRQKGELALLQANAQKNAQETNKINKILGYSNVRSMLRVAQVGPDKERPAKNEQYDRFVGLFMDQVQLFEGQNKRPPNEEEAGKITAKLLAETTVPNRLLPSWTGSRTQRQFEVDVPDEERTKILPLVRERWPGLTKTEEDKRVKELYIRGKFGQPQ